MQPDITIAPRDPFDAACFACDTAIRHWVGPRGRAKNLQMLRDAVGDHDEALVAIDDLESAWKELWSNGGSVLVVTDYLTSVRVAFGRA